eukprot:TRINITY_DN10569_c0_g1_i2.p1 TRINITY_DN10569_c0_g1~~TRINITY_DN10569_c0_g1_i2.p1  ORF type:complete len:561 (+),score=129.85 TRINITY_DN10569_c0_g1_i2:83-1765(+)
MSDGVGESVGLLVDDASRRESPKGPSPPGNPIMPSIHLVEEVPFLRKAAFALGAFPSMSTHTVVGFFLSPFLLEVAGVPAYIVSVCTFLGRAWDAVTDPTVGYLVSRTNTRYGALKPWMSSALVPCILCYFCLWLVPDWSDNAKAAYYILLYLSYQTFFTMYQVPYTSLTMHVSRDSKQRDQATSLRMVIETVALLMGSVVQGIIISSFVKTESKECTDCSADDGKFTVYKPAADAYMLSGGIISILCLITGAVVIFGVPEEKTTKQGGTGSTGATPNKMSFWKSFKSCMKNKSYTILTLMFLWAWMANNVNQANFILWLKYGFDREAEFQYFLITLLATTTLALPLWYTMMRIFGKPTAFSIGLLLQLPWTLAQFWLPSDVPSIWLHVGICSSSIGLGAVYLLPWAMLPDVIDESQLNTGQRNEAVFYSFFVFFQKFGSGVAIAASTLAIQYSGYKSKLCCPETSQPPGVRTTLKYLATVTPAMLILISFFFTQYYPLTTERCAEIKAFLATRYEKREKEGLVPETVALDDDDDGCSPGEKDQDEEGYTSMQQDTSTSV